MKLRKKKKISWQNLIFNRFFLTFIGLAIIALVSFPLARNIRQQRALDKEIENLKQEIAKMEKRNESLEKLIDYLGSDQFAEEQARLQLGLKKAGEEVIVVKGIGSSTDSLSNQIYDLPAFSSGKKELTNPQKWWRYFFQPKT